MHARQAVPYHAFMAYRRALLLSIETEKTLDVTRLRLALPLTEDERKQGVNLLRVLEDTVKAWTSDASNANLELIQVAKTFSLALASVGNREESRRLYVDYRRKQGPPERRPRQRGSTSRRPCIVPPTVEPEECCLAC